MSMHRQSIHWIPESFISTLFFAIWSILPMFSFLLSTISLHTPHTSYNGLQLCKKNICDNQSKIDKFIRNNKHRSIGKRNVYLCFTDEMIKTVQNFGLSFIVAFTMSKSYLHFQNKLSVFYFQLETFGNPACIHMLILNVYTECFLSLSISFFSFVYLFLPVKTLSVVGVEKKFCCFRPRV